MKSDLIKNYYKKDGNHMNKESYENGLWIQNKSIVYIENIDDLKKSHWNTVVTYDMLIHKPIVLIDKMLTCSFITPINKRCNLFVVIYHIILQLLHSFLQPSVQWYLYTRFLLYKALENIHKSYKIQEHFYCYISVPFL